MSFVNRDVYSYAHLPLVSVVQHVKHALILGHVQPSKYSLLHLLIEALQPDYDAMNVFPDASNIGHNLFVLLHEFSCRNVHLLAEPLKVGGELMNQG